MNFKKNVLYGKRIHRVSSQELKNIKKRRYYSNKKDLK